MSEEVTENKKRNLFGVYECSEVPIVRSLRDTHHPPSRRVFPTCHGALTTNLCGEG